MDGSRGARRSRDRPCQPGRAGCRGKRRTLAWWLFQQIQDEARGRRGEAEGERMRSGDGPSQEVRKGNQNSACLGSSLGCSPFSSSSGSSSSRVQGKGKQAREPFRAMDDDPVYLILDWPWHRSVFGTAAQCRSGAQRRCGLKKVKAPGSSGRGQDPITAVAKGRIVACRRVRTDGLLPGAPNQDRCGKGQKGCLPVQAQVRREGSDVQNPDRAEQGTLTIDEALVSGCWKGVR